MLIRATLIALAFSCIGSANASAPSAPAESPSSSDTADTLTPVYEIPTPVAIPPASTHLTSRQPVRQLSIKSNLGGHRFFVIAPDGESVYVLRDEVSVDIWGGIVYHWPEISGVSIVLIVGYLLWRMRRLRKLRRELGEEYCRYCNYHLRGATSDQCPECGHDITGRGRVKAGRMSRPFAMVVILAIVGWGVVFPYFHLVLLGEIDREPGMARWLDWKSTRLYEWSRQSGWELPTRYVSMLNWIDQFDLATGDRLSRNAWNSGATPWDHGKSAVVCPTRAFELRSLPDWRCLQTFDVGSTYYHDRAVVDPESKYFVAFGRDDEAVVFWAEQQRKPTILDMAYGNTTVLPLYSGRLLLIDVFEDPDTPGRIGLHYRLLDVNSMQITRDAARWGDMAHPVVARPRGFVERANGNQVIVWDEHLQPVQSFVTPPHIIVFGLWASPRGDLLSLSLYDTQQTSFEVIILDLETNSIAERLPSAGSSFPICRWSADGRWLAVMGDGPIGLVQNTSDLVVYDVSDLYE